MSKQTGMGANLYIGGFALSGDAQAVNISSPRGTSVKTGIDKSAFERIYLTKDGAIGLTMYFNPATDQAHPVLSALPTSDQPITYVHRPTIGAPAASMVGKQTNYDPTRDANGDISGIAVQSLANGYGLEWGRMHTAGQLTQSSAGAGSALDYGASIGETLFGLQAYLHVFAFTGTSVTVAVQGSADGSTGWANITGAVFNAASAVGSQRLQTARDATVPRHLRVNTTGTFSNAVFAVNVIKNQAEVLF